MLKVENKSKDEITKIGRKIGEAFAAERIKNLRLGFRCIQWHTIHHQQDDSW